MTEPDELLNIIIEYHDGQEDGDIGSPYYVASCDAIGLTTDGQTIDELFKNLREAVELALDEDDTVATYNIIPNPRINIIMELSDYAQIA